MEGNGPDLASARRDVVDLRRALQAGVELESQATSIDGRTFEFIAPIADPVPLGGFVVIAAGDDRRYLGQVSSRAIDQRSGARVSVDVPDVAVGSARVSQAEIQLEQRLAVGSGTLLARLDGADLMPMTLDDVFDDADMAVAPAEVVQLFIESGRKGSGLDVGWSPFAGPEVRTTLRSGGFNRHTFLCGQSGSGKTFSLGVILERLLLETTLPMVVIDPNSDYVHLGQLRPKESFDKTVAVPMAEDVYAATAAKYESVAKGIRVLAVDNDSAPLRIRFSDLTPAEQAKVLRLDPLENALEYRAFRRIADRMGDRPYTLEDIRAATRQTLQEDARQIGLRIENLGIADWELWAGRETSAADEQLDAERRAVVLDVGGMSNESQQHVVAMAVLGRLWRRRTERRPLLVVIDEAHNVCPAEPTNPLQELAMEHVVRIAGEGRKFGIYLLLSTQRPQKLHPNVLSQCDNLLLMRMNSLHDIDHLAGTFSFVPPTLLQQAAGFRLGEALLAGKISPTPTLTKIEGRFSVEGGGDVSSSWARPSSP